MQYDNGPKRQRDLILFVALFFPKSISKKILPCVKLSFLLQNTNYKTDHQDNLNKKLSNQNKATTLGKVASTHMILSRN